MYFIIGDHVAWRWERCLEHRLFHLLFDGFGRRGRGWNFFFFLYLWFSFQFLHHVDESFLGENSAFILLVVEAIEMLDHLIEPMNGEIVLHGMMVTSAICLLLKF